MPTMPAGLLGPGNVQSATALFNGMIHPLCPFAIRGAIWYQGEANEAEGSLYTERMKALIGGWRTIWGEGGFSVLFRADRPLRLQRWTDAPAGILGSPGRCRARHPQHRHDRRETTSAIRGTFIRLTSRMSVFAWRCVPCRTPMAKRMSWVTHRLSNRWPPTARSSA